MAGMTMPLAALPARAALNAPASSSRKPSPWFALLSTAALLVVTAVALVRIHPLEARQTVLASSGSLFATALASQRRDHAKKLKEVEKAKKDMREKLDGEEGESHHHHLSDAALLRQAVKAQQRDEMKARKAAATMKEQLKAKSSFTAMPSQHETLSDAKLYQDALKEQKQDRQKREAATKKTAVVQAKKIQRLQAIKKAEQQKKLQAELKFIISASDVSSKSKEQPKPSAAADPSVKKHLTSRAKSSHVHSKDLLDKAGEMNLVKYLDSQGGSKVKPVISEKVVTLDKLREKAAEKKAEEAKRKMKSIVRLATKYHVVSGHVKGKGDWARKAMYAADVSLAGKKGRRSYMRAEFARANAIEDSLLSSKLP